QEHYVRPIKHLLCGLTLAAGDYLITGNKESSLSCAAGAVLCDTDHIIYMETKQRPIYIERESNLVKDSDNTNEI
nr:hypothetical protein [Eubacterium sp.]